MKVLPAIAIAAVFSLAASVAAAKEFRLGLITPPSHLWTAEAEALAESFESETEGRYSMSIFPSGQLGSEAQMLQQLQTGALDMAFMTMSEVSNRVPNMGAFFAPYLVKDSEEAAKLLKSDVAYGLLDELPQRMGVIGLGYGMAGMRILNGRESINTAEDLKGKKVRITPFAPTRDFHNILGVAPTPMPLPAVYDALANGQVDAVEIDVQNVLQQDYISVAPYVVLSRHMMFPMVAVASPRTLAQMDDEDLTTLEKLVGQHLDSLLKEMVEKEAEWTAQLKANENATVTEAGPEFFGDAIEKWEQEWAKKAPALKELRAEAEKY